MNASRRAREHDDDRKPLTDSERRIVRAALAEFDAHMAQKIHMSIEQFATMLRDLRDTVVPWVVQRAAQEKEWAGIKLHVKKTVLGGAAWALIVGLFALAILGAPAFATWLAGRFA